MKLETKGIIKYDPDKEEDNLVMKAPTLGIDEPLLDNLDHPIEDLPNLIDLLQRKIQQKIQQKVQVGFNRPVEVVFEGYTLNCNFGVIPQANRTLDEFEQAAAKGGAE